MFMRPASTPLTTKCGWVGAAMISGFRTFSAATSPVWLPRSTEASPISQSEIQCSVSWMPGLKARMRKKLAIKAAIVARKPDRLSYLQAAAMALIGITAIWAIEDTAQLQAGETILIQGGAGGVAGFTIQLAKYRGATVFTTTSAANVDYVRTPGADRVIDYNAEDFTKVISDCDVVFDMVGGDVQTRSYSALKPGGAVGLGRTGAGWISSTTIGCDWYCDLLSGVIVHTPGADRVALLDAGAVSPPPIAPYDLADAAEAHRVSEGRHLRGKLVLAAR